MSGTPLAIAVVGLGSIGLRHAQAARREPGFTLAAVVDPSPAAAAWSREAGVDWYERLDSLLTSRRLDGVIVATPNALHRDATIACLERGIPVLVEKPIADTLQAARAIVDATSRTGVPVLVGHQRRHNPILRTARDYIAGGRLGTLIAANATSLRRKRDAYFNVAWRREPGGGPLLINGIHEIDCLRMLCGDVAAVSAVAGHHARALPVEDTICATLSFESGALGTFALSDAVEAPWAWEMTSGEEQDFPAEDESCFLVCGTQGSLALPSLDCWRNRAGGGRGDTYVRERLVCAPADPWLVELRHFGDLVRGLCPPEVGAVEGARTLATVLAIADAARSGAHVPVPSIIAPSSSSRPSP